MTPWFIVAASLVGGALLLGWGRARVRAGRSLEEALPACSIAELEPGRFRVIGRVVPIETTESLVDGLACV